MTALASIPAWGYDYVQRQEAAYLTYKQNRHPDPDAPNYLPINEVYPRDQEKAEEKKRQYIFRGNMAKVLEAIPGVNVIVGLARVLFGAIGYSLVSDPLLREEAKLFIIRGCCAIIAGPLLPIVDWIVTLAQRSMIDEVLRQHGVA